MNCSLNCGVTVLSNMLIVGRAVARCPSLKTYSWLVLDMRDAAGTEHLAAVSRVDRCAYSLFVVRQEHLLTCPLPYCCQGSKGRRNVAERDSRLLGQLSL